MDADKIKNFFIYHCEKMIVAGVVGLAGFLVYSGMGLPLILDKQNPSKLTEEAKQVRASIDEDHNDMVLVDRNDPTLDVIARTNRSTSPVDANPYKWRNVLEPKNIDGSVRRSDPVLVAPRHLKMKPVIATIALRSNTGEYAVKNLEPADPVKVTVVKPKQKKKSRREEMMMGMEMGMGMEDPSMMGMDPSMMGMGDPSMMGMGESMAGSLGSGRKLDPKHNFGVGSDDISSTSPTIKNKPQISWFISGTAVMPHKELVEAYELALKDAAGYNSIPGRDYPLYYNLELQRADVTDRAVDTLTDKDWIKRGDRLFYTKMARDMWAGVAKELVPQDYWDAALTSYIPPVLIDDYYDFALHPLVPLTPPEKPTLVAPAETNEPIKAPSLSDQLGDDSMFNIPGMNAGMMTDFMSDPMMQGMDFMGGYGGMMNQVPVDYKLVRVYDFTAIKDDPNPPMPGRKYVYRVRVGIVDPNFPIFKALQPRSNSLSKEVYDRVSELLAAEQSGRDRTKEKLFQRWTDWSAPSEPVSLPASTEHFVGPVTSSSSKPVKVGNRLVPYNKDEPLAKVITSQFDGRLHVRIPLPLTDVTKGTVLSAKGTAEVIDPLTMEIKKLPDAQVKSTATVVDLEGGLPLEIAPDEKMTTPGMFLLFDESGQLRVSEEISDQEFYRIYSFADEKGE